MLNRFFSPLWFVVGCYLTKKSVRRNVFARPKSAKDHSRDKNHSGYLMIQNWRDFISLLISRQDKPMSQEKLGKEPWGNSLGWMRCLLYILSMIAAIYASVNDQSSLVEFFVYGVYLCDIQDGVQCLQWCSKPDYGMCKHSMMAKSCPSSPDQTFPFRLNYDTWGFHIFASHHKKFHLWITLQCQGVQ
jgi:hypothetical protein